jgi:CubicO group peptidase (beta-lactamase class C family)
MAPVAALGVALCGCGRHEASPPAPAPIVVARDAPTLDAGAAADPAMVARLDALAAATVAQAPLLGLSVAIVRDGKVVLEKGYGFADLARTVPITAETVFQIGSVTKQFTAVAILQLVDQHKLALDDQLAKYVPAFTRAITIGQLLEQTSGIQDFSRPENEGKDQAALVAAIAAAPSEFEPGSKFGYSNSNYYLLGRVIEQVTGHTYAEVIDQLAVTAGLRATRYCATPLEARGSMVRAGAIAGARYDLRFYDAAGALCSSATDLVRWEAAVSGDALLAPATRAYRITPPTLTAGVTAYGAGVVVNDLAGHHRIWHSGAVPSGFESQLSYFPDDHLVIALLTNTALSPPGILLPRLEDQLAHVVLAIPEPTVLDLRIPPSVLQAVTGTYAMAQVSVEIVATDGQLHVKLPGGRESRLMMQDATTFVLEINPHAAYRFVIVDGRATAIDYLTNDSVAARLTRAP